VAIIALGSVMNIREAIAEKQKLIKRLEQEITALQVAATILEGFPVGLLTPKTQPEMAASILEDVGKPMHVEQIAGQIKKSFAATIKTNNLGVMLFRYAKRGNRFYKVKGKPNTYGLIKWQDLSERIEATRNHSSDVVASST